METHGFKFDLQRRTRSANAFMTRGQPPAQRAAMPSPPARAARTPDA